MNREEFLENFKEVLQTDEEIQFDTVLADLGDWDSLAMMSTMAFLDKNFGLKVPLSEYAEMKTIDDIAKRAGL